MTQEEIIDHISKIRERNNKNWMDILRLAFKGHPKDAQEIMARISEADAEITKLTMKLGETKE